MATNIENTPLAQFGGPKTVDHIESDLFHWPIVTEEDERDVRDVLRTGTMKKLDVTCRCEADFAEFQSVKYALGYCNGTMAMLGAMYAVGISRDDEIICPSLTY